MGTYSYKLECVRKTKFVIKRSCGGFAGVDSCSSEPLLSCHHSTVRNRRCIFCNQAMDGSFGLSFDYMLPGLRYSEEEVLVLKKRNTKALLRKRKLHLVLDLDHTLLHFHPFNGTLFQIDDDNLVKLRPFVRTFLEQASSLFEMYVCTMGTRCYAKAAVKLLDPDSKYFSSRIIAREDFNGKDRKDLDLVLGQERGIVILDDTESVWSDRTENLIVVAKYDYFRDKELKGDHKSYSETQTDESENEGVLTNVLRVLKTIHRLFFDSVCGDVRTYLPKIRRGILKGCSLLFSDFEDFIRSSSRAEEMGATCTIVIDSVTHLVSTEPEDCLCPEQEEKFLVHPRWIDDCYFLWHRQPEDDYLP
ncbi:RNA polymerase II C-terminal domain phosphatase-like 4 [Citrus sinensis]|nr:RNA polymerase II C-terminal domain phosphatase-like 4 [Citrus sinensis]